MKSPSRPHVHTRTIDHRIRSRSRRPCVVVGGDRACPPFQARHRAAIGWIGLIWLSPVLGAILYLLLGINRIERKARKLLRGRAHFAPAPQCPNHGGILESTVGVGAAHLAALSQLVDQIGGAQLLAGNELELLVGGDEAYPAMIRAIDGASRSIALGTYIFDDDRAGRPFVDALGRAVGRGVQVRVLIDDFGSRHRWWSVVGPLRNVGVPVARFLPTLAPGWFPYLNLRNHRKILVVDGCVGFTGGMNILEDYMLGLKPRFPKLDLQVRVRGPAVAALWRVFAEDWAHRHRRGSLRRAMELARWRVRRRARSRHRRRPGR